MSVGQPQMSNSSLTSHENRFSNGILSSFFVVVVVVDVFISPRFIAFHPRRLRHMIIDSNSKIINGANAN